MAATRQDISHWFDLGVKQGDKYMVILCDTYDYCDYPVYAKTEKDCASMANSPGEMQRVMEVYDLNMDKVGQLNSHRAMNLPSLEKQ